MTQTIGILGAGQLGRMLALAGQPLGFQFRFFDPAAGTPCAGLGEQHRAAFEDQAALRKFAQGLSLVTLEFENVPVEALDTLSPILPVRPNAKALRISQDRLLEKDLCRELGISTPQYETVASRSDLEKAVQKLGFPCVLKTRRFGYDGKGQAVLKSRADTDAAWQSLQAQELILESWVPFSREVSIIAARSLSGEIAFYPLSENQHRLGILRVSSAPAEYVPALYEQAKNIIQKVLQTLEYVGVLAIELFDVDGKLIFNEMAPRVHNSGHWTIDGASCSQFENHLRAVAGLPLGSTAVPSYCRMFNFIGRLPAVDKLSAIPGCHVHLYNKTERKSRKIGHCTVVAKTKEELEQSSMLVQSLISDDG